MVVFFTILCMEAKQMDKLLTVKDVAEYLQMSKEKIYRLAQQGKIRVSRIENQWRFRLEKLNTRLEANEIYNPPKHYNKMAKKK